MTIAIQLLLQRDRKRDARRSVDDTTRDRDSELDSAGSAASNSDEKKAVREEVSPMIVG